jgi:hypothetical protein
MPLMKIFEGRLEGFRNSKEMMEIKDSGKLKENEVNLMLF